MRLASGERSLLSTTTQRRKAAQRTGIHSAQRSGQGVQTVRPGYLQMLERLAPKVSGEDEDELHQPPRRESDGHTLERQVAELSIRASTLNRFTELGTPKTVSVGSLCLGLRVT
jgi:hypothetical protein